MVENVPSPLISIMIFLQIAVVPLILMRRGMGKWRAALWGLAAGLRGLPAAWQSRREVQRRRVISNAEIARMLAWSPRKALRRTPLFLESKRSDA